MKTLIDNPVFYIMLTLAAYFIGQKIQEKTKWVIMNPILIAMLLIIGFLVMFNIDYETYHENSKMIDFMLQPAIVCLAIPLFYQLKRIKQQAFVILVSSVLGSITGVLSVFIIAWSMGAPKEIVLSLVPKSITTPIAMDVSKVIGGIPSLTACIVMFTGIFGSIFGYLIMHYTWVRNPIAQGFSIGMASHVVGTSRSMEISNNYGAFSTVGLIINGIFTAILAPYILLGMQWLFHF